MTLSGVSQNTNVFFTEADAFFEANVVNGKVAYASIKDNQGQLNKLLRLAEAFTVSGDDESINKAFWINAYNICVIKGIVDNYPIKSPLDKAGFFDKDTYKLAGETLTLNAIEHEKLIAGYKDARFHFVLVCGALGCPPLINEVYMPATVETQLDIQTKKALNGSFLKVNSKKKRVEVSQIMEWYKDDFTIDDRTEIDFINSYRTEKIPDNYRLTYFPYDWSLNE
ncbi:DUF547 domain-containing protein [Snuella sp. CAU 1569]|uniref:DUF547 domain-containing protein n=2 Tax=Snuella sedimenti TaxID=2798802 RepID=A0A8J7IFL4_9FLAO|nr:DUF547 domain-containing protein [Snuella sedimenti]